MKLVLVRHGETDWNTQHRTQGTTDTPLNERGMVQARTLAPRIQRQFPPEIIYTSPLQRAVRTAEILRGDLPVPIVPDERLLEFHFGAWEGMEFPKIGEAFPEEMKVWQTNPMDCVIPGAETMAELQKRCAAFLDDLKCTDQEKTVLVVSHALTCKLIIAGAIGLEPRHIHTLRIDNTSLNVLDVLPHRSILRLFNDTCHMEEEV